MVVVRQEGSIAGDQAVAESRPLQIRRPPGMACLFVLIRRCRTQLRRAGATARPTASVVAAPAGAAICPRTRLHIPPGDERGVHGLLATAQSRLLVSRCKIFSLYLSLLPITCEYAVHQQLAMQKAACACHAVADGNIAPHTQHHDTSLCNTAPPQDRHLVPDIDNILLTCSTTARRRTPGQGVPAHQRRRPLQGCQSRQRRPAESRAAATPRSLQPPPRGMPRSRLQAASVAFVALTSGCLSLEAWRRSAHPARHEASRHVQQTTV